MQRTPRIKPMLWLGIASFLMFLIALAPASILANRLAALSNNRLFLAVAEGSIWHGQGHLLLAGAENHTDLTRLDLGKFTWQLAFLPLLKGELAVSITQFGHSPMLVRLSSESVIFEHLNLSFPATVITGWIPTLQTIQPSGHIEVNGDNLMLGQADYSGTATLEWRQASALLSPVHPLGHYIAKIKGVNETFQIQVSTYDGALKIEGDGQWTLRNGLKFQGTAKADAAYAQLLKPLLHTLGNRTGSDTDAYTILYQ